MINPHKEHTRAHSDSQQVAEKKKNREEEKKKEKKKKRRQKEKKFSFFLLFFFFEFMQAICSTHRPSTPSSWPWKYHEANMKGMVMIIIGFKSTSKKTHFKINSFFSFSFAFQAMTVLEKRKRTKGDSP